MHDIQLFYFPTEVTKEMGGTRYHPGTHLRIVNEMAIAKYQNILGQKSIVCKPGTIGIFHSGLWHGAGVNFSENIPSQIFNQLTNNRKDLLGLNTYPPKDEFTRITRRSNEFEWKNNYQLP